MGTNQEDDAEDLEEDIGAEQKNSDDKHDSDSAHSEPVEREASLDDQREQTKVEELIRESCGCQLGAHGGACSSAVSKEAITLTRNSSLQMSRKELGLVYMAQISALRTPAAPRLPSAHVTTI